MSGLLIAFITSFICTLLIVRYQHLHGHFTHDDNLSSPQKFHLKAVPRIGGISIFLGLSAATVTSAIEGAPKTSTLFFIFVSAIPCFAIGFWEDITKAIGVKIRLFFTALSALMLIYFLSVNITRLGIFGVDSALAIPIISIAFTCFAITGLANAYNIIDGFNGLASMVALISLSSIAYVGIIVRDPMISSLAFVMIGAIAGFFLWNYPRGLIFLGDGGSYLIGFWIAALSILLVSRNGSVSPWFAVMVNGYPIFETLFTIYRRTFNSRRNLGMPDGIHFHTLLFRRVLRPATRDRPFESDYIANAKTSPYLWTLSGFSVLPATMWWYSDALLIIFSFAFMLTYVLLYRSIIKFKTPRWLHFL
jgi:UDP-N-acetylmuramyl pentapeptide phosphotransferase/UDP-N-acetylglucosamine-1-phosphate transferase